jgi:starch phosphorylase
MNSHISSPNSGQGLGHRLPFKHDLGSVCPCEDPTALNLAKHLLFDHVISPSLASPRAQFEAVARAIRDKLVRRWFLTEDTFQQTRAKRVYYLSMEFLMGRALEQNVLHLGLESMVNEACREYGLDWQGILEQEPDPGLGNGGLGRLAACLMDSLATLGYPAMGYGLRYDYGIFKQTFWNGWQCEQPDHWLRRPDPWEVARPEQAVQVHLNCSFELSRGQFRIISNQPSVLRGVPYDRPIVGYGGRTINTLRLWKADSLNLLDFQRFSQGDFVDALSGSLGAETITRLLYPDDSTPMGRGLRFVQEYFLVACSVADVIRRFRQDHDDWSELPSRAVFQLNDTHPALAVPELLRVLLDEAKLGWDQAWDLTRQCLAYTNHTLLPEALEKWPQRYLKGMIPRQLELMHEINRRWHEKVSARYPGDKARLKRMSLVEPRAPWKMRMAHVAMVGSHRVNGVSRIHTELLKKNVVPDFVDMLPERFVNMTNGITPRRWLLQANPGLAGLITEVIGPDWITDLSQLARLKSMAGDPGMGEALRKSKHQAKHCLVDWMQRQHGVSLNPDTLFDCHVKRIHEYKRQLLNALHIVILFDRLRKDPAMDIPARTFVFAGKAAPSYRIAKLIIKFINNLAVRIQNEPSVREKIQVVFVPDYNVSVAEKIIAASDVSEQISTAGYEASGTGNMKFMLNGALTIGTYDGATIEMAESAGSENLFLFGLTAQQVAETRYWYNPKWHYENDQDTRIALDLIRSGEFDLGDSGVFHPLLGNLLEQGDYFMHLADLSAYVQTQQHVGEFYQQPHQWSQRAWLNIAGAGPFSSDRTVHEYARNIWALDPVEVP